MIKANLEKDYPLMTKNFVIFTDFEEESYVSRLFNTLNSAHASLNLQNYKLDKIKDFKQLAIRSCQQYSTCGFQFNELAYFLKQNFDFKTSDYIFIGSEGLFESREEYHKWQQLYGLLKPIEKSE